MAYSHLKIQELIEDTDSEGNNRIRARFEEFKPRTGYINLKKATAAQITKLKELVGGSGMVGIREGMMNGQTYFQLLDEEIIPIHQPEKIPVSKVVEIENKQPPKVDLSHLTQK
jgi:hypothetical protein